MHLAGKGTGRKPLPDGGPDQGGKEKFNAIGGPLTEIWSTHAVVNVIMAHSLIRSFKEVDPDRTAVTGISWGGYLTCIVAGLDDRFKAAVPVCGCGFLHHGSAWNQQFEMMTPELRAKWVRLFDPSTLPALLAMQRCQPSSSTARMISPTGWSSIARHTVW